MVCLSVSLSRLLQSHGACHMVSCAVPAWDPGSLQQTHLQVWCAYLSAPCPPATHMASLWGRPGDQPPWFVGLPLVSTLQQAAGDLQKILNTVT